MGKASIVKIFPFNFDLKINLNFRKPTHENDSDEVLLPIQKDQTNCIIFTNDGLTSSPNPRQEAIEFWSGIEQKSTKLSAKSKKKERDEL